MEALLRSLQPTQACHCSSLRRASRALTQHYERHFRGSGLRSTQFTVLSTIAQAGPTPLTRLADLLALERTALGRALRPLAERGLVDLREGDDARERIASITAAGRRQLVDTLPCWKAAQRSAPGVMRSLGLPGS